MHKYKKLLFIFLLAIGLQTKAQVTLQHTYSTPGDNFQWVYLEHSGFKYVYFNGLDSINLYNLNYSVFKTIVIPGTWSIYNPPQISFISEGLFDTDTLHVDYMVDLGSTPDTFAIYKDNGTLVFSENNAHVIYNIGSIVGIVSPIFNSDSGTFMIVTQQNPSGQVINNQIYKLGGKLPCMPTCTGGNPPLGIENMSTTSNGYSAIYPNPATNYTDIYYKLPAGNNSGEIVLYDMTGREIKRYNVDTRFDHLHITTSDVSAGTYFYQLTSNGQSISAKKLIVVK